jgi:hypothetical protein
MDAQDIGNRHGAALRAIEAALADGDVDAAKAAAKTAHDTAGEIYTFATDVAGLDLDWDQLAGNHQADAQARDGGVPKSPPQAN